MTDTRKRRALDVVVDQQATHSHRIRGRVIADIRDIGYRELGLPVVKIGEVDLAEVGDPLAWVGAEIAVQGADLAAGFVAIKNPDEIAKAQVGRHA